MKLLKTQDLANEMGLSFFTVQKYIQANELPGRKLGGTWVTTDRELRDYMSGKEARDIKLVQLFDVRGAAEFLKTDVPTTRRMIKANRLNGTSIDNRGSGVGTQVFTLRQVKAAKKHVPGFLDAQPGRPIQDNIDDYIYVSSKANGNAYHAIRDTYDRNHINYSYRHLHQARARARQAHNAEPVYREGEKVEIYIASWEEGNKCHIAFIEHDITPICRSAQVRIFSPGREWDKFDIVVPVPDGILGRVTEEKDESSC